MKPHRKKSAHDRQSQPTARGYPRPQLVRDHFALLNGQWDFALDPDAQFTLPHHVTFSETINVPFAPETPASGLAHTGFFRACWYRRNFQAPDLHDGQRLLLHFGAVDDHASVWVNDHLVIQHEGGYTPFHADITDLLIEGSEQTIVVRAHDDPADLAKPRGKQDWLKEPHSIWYMRTTGIWQSVWLETVPATYIESLRWSCNVEHWQIHLHLRIAGQLRDNLRVAVTLTHQGQIIADDIYSLAGRETSRTISLPDPGIDDARFHLLWQPNNPTLIDAHIRLLDGAGQTLDTIQSYTALRSVGVLGNRFMLNGRPYYLRLVLDQGYWPDSGLTAPDDEALKKDVELVKAMGFNGVRKHQKIEDPRFLYWADHLGLLVWEEMPSPYTFTDQTILRVSRQWPRAIERDISHPCIIAWMPFNESWGVPDLPLVPAQRHFVHAMYHLTKSLDPSRPVIGNDGWENQITDIIGIHDYEANPQRLAHRYAHATESVEHLFQNIRPAGRLLLLQETVHTHRPIMLTEFGGIAFSKEHGAWGYSRANTAPDFAARFGHLLATIRPLELFAGYCYTQFTDTYQEANGLLYMNRMPKIPLAEIATATRGPESPRDRKIESQWRHRLAALQKQEDTATD